jgi:catechol 2,3-dioxygenase-like lactoylglutathione lyase family enzyme
MITQLAHTAYRVRNLQESLDFYAKLGLREAFRLNRDDGSTWIVYLQINEDQFVELFPLEDAALDAAPARASYHHFCLQVDDIETTVRELESRGITIDRPISMGLDYNYQSWVVDPNGNRIELMQIMPDSLQAKAAAAYLAAKGGS